MRKFIQPVSMKVSPDDDIKHLLRGLEYMGYVGPITDNFASHPFLVNNFAGNIGRINNVTVHADSRHERIVLTEFNPDLFLALAAMSEGIEFYPGEWVVSTHKWASGITDGTMTMVEKTHEGSFNCDHGLVYSAHFRKATAEEIINHFTEKKDYDDTLLDGPLPVIDEKYIHLGPGEYRGEYFVCTNTKGEFSRFKGLSTEHTVLCYNNGWAKTFISANPEDKATEFADKMKLSKALTDEPTRMEMADALSDAEESVKRPPLGIMPRKHWEERRIFELFGCIGRYLQADKDVPFEWSQELYELLGKRTKSESPF